MEYEIDLDFRGVSPKHGGRPVNEDRTEPELDSDNSFTKAHYEQQFTVNGTIRVADELLDIDGRGLRDKSWGPRHWQAIFWYRWIPMVVSPDFAMMVSVVGGGAGGMVLKDGVYQMIRDCTIDSDRVADCYQTAMRCHIGTDTDTSWAGCASEQPEYGKCTVAAFTRIERGRAAPTHQITSVTHRSLLELVSEPLVGFPRVLERPNMPTIMVGVAL